MKCSLDGCPMPAVDKGFYVHRDMDLTPYIKWYRLCERCAKRNEPFKFKTRKQAITYAVTECLGFDLNAK